MSVVKLDDHRPKDTLRTEMHGEGAWEAVRAYFEEARKFNDVTYTSVYLDGCADYLCQFLYDRGFDIVPAPPDTEPCEADEEELKLVNA
jgi:hypothetical protein